MVNPGPGRPRLEQRRRPGGTPAAEILDAAAELFTNNGYANTSTRKIADAVGIRQASLYHHFATKDDILDSLLADTIADALELALRLLDRQEPAAARLYALVRFDVSQLCSSRWNLAALYLLPELRTERFASFRERRDELRGHYATLAAKVISDRGGRADRAVSQLPFRLVETVINVRSDDGKPPSNADKVIPEAALRVLGWSGDVDEVRATSKGLLKA